MISEAHDEWLSSYAAECNQVLASCVAEPNYHTLAVASMWLGWSTEETTCKDVGFAVGMTENEQDSMKAAVETLTKELDRLRKTFSSTIEEDEVELARVKNCRGSKGIDDGLACPSDVREWGPALEMAILFRVTRKKLIKAVHSRLTEDCLRVHDIRGDETESDVQPFSLRYGRFGEDEL